LADPLAVYGAVIGTTAAAGALWNIYHGWWRDRARLALGIKLGGGPIIGWGRHTVDPRQNVYLSITNRGRRPVRVESAGLLHKDGSSLVLMQDSLGQQVFSAVLDERNPSVDVCARTRDLQERYSAGGQSPPSHIFCHTAARRHTRRLGQPWIRFLTSAPVPDPGEHVEEAAAETGERPAG
jgi:hypothetical protein